MEVTEQMIVEWGAQFFPHFTIRYQRKAVLAVLLAKLNQPKENQP